MAVKPCQGCKSQPAVTGERFCAQCRSLQIDQMETDRYFLPDSFPSDPGRPREAQEDIDETKHGRDEWRAGIEFEQLVENLAGVEYEDRNKID